MIQKTNSSPPGPRDPAGVWFFYFRGSRHPAISRDDHLGGNILPSMFKKQENSTHDDIHFAPHKTPNFNISQVRMKRGTQEEILIENFRPSRYLLDALAAAR